jgi:hypothetical protein
MSRDIRANVYMKYLLLNLNGREWIGRDRKKIEEEHLADLYLDGTDYIRKYQ